MPANSSAPKYLKMRFIIVSVKNRVQRYNKKTIYANAKQEKFVLWQFLHIFSNGIRTKVLQKSYKSLIWVLAEFAKHAARLMWKN